MYLTPDIQLQNRLLRWSKYLALAVFAIGFFVLIGWQFNVQLFKQPITGMVVMNPVTACAFIFSAISFLLLTAGKTKQKILTGKLIAIIIFITGLVKTIAVISGLDFPIDQVLFHDKVNAAVTANLTNRMAPNTAICFVLAGMALLLLNFETRKKRRPAQFVALLIGMAGLLSVLGYLYRVETFYGVFSYVPMAIHTAVGFLLLAISILFAAPGEGIMKNFTSTFAGSVTARRLIPPALLVPPVLGLLRLHGNRLGLYSNEFGVAVFALSLVTVFLCLIWYNSIQLNKRDAQKKSTEDILQQSREQVTYLAGLIEKSNDGIISFDTDFRIKSWNRAAEIIYGYSQNEVMNLPSRQIFRSDESEAVLEERREQFKKNGYWTGEVKQYKKDGSSIICLLSSTVLKNDTGEASGYLSVAKDITERKEAEERISYLARLVEDTGDAVFSADANFNIKSWNKASELFYGYTPKEVMGQPVGDIIRPQVSLEVRQARREELKRLGYWKGEVVHLKKDDTAIVVLVSNSVTRNSRGELDGYISVCRDISDRKKAEAALQQLNNELEQNVKERTEEIIKNEKRFRALVEYNDCIIALIDKDFQTIYLSPSSERITGWSPEERKTVGSTEQAHPDDREHIDKVMKEVAENPGKPVNIAMRTRHRQGHYVWLEGTAMNMFHDPGVAAVIMNLRDITKRKEAEAALGKSEALYRSLFENMLHGFSYCKVIFENEKAVDFTYIAVNNAYESLTGLKDVTGKRIQEVIPGMDKTEPELFNMITRVALNGIPEKYETYIVELDKWFSVSMFSPEKGYFVALNDNITERKKAEQQISNANIELEEKVAKRTMQLKKSSEEMEAFSYSVSHDLRAPLRAIIGFAAILQDDYGDKLDDEAKRITSIIKSNTLKMGRLIDDLLTFSRMGRHDILKTCINTNEMLKEVVSDIKNQNTAIEWNVEPLPDIYGDLNMMRQVWINLVSNAVKYSGKTVNPRIEIGTFKSNGDAAFYIRDNGVGFDQQYVNKLFKVFQRLHSVHEFEGTGVGLAIVEKIISKHGGKVWATGEKDKGASFYFSLPAEGED